MKFRDLTANEIDVRVGQVGDGYCTLLLYKDARVDMDAESTSMMTIPISASGSVESIEGIMASYATEPSSLYIAAVS